MELSIDIYVSTLTLVLGAPTRSHKVVVEATTYLPRIYLRKRKLSALVGEIVEEHMFPKEQLISTVPLDNGYPGCE